ncbi:hypothetical protein A8F94_21815 [Bacillus sp. FJAT-27225]|uniref:MASE3 domain-containing protein n=1 Tax=Bacillus sp. FJAT-27225 TaxID=1743144 RepID=UPI00080C24EF|nr:MASE3 domain-containing protein [Bacillus sp. FJAT-27225]OCA81516.1 hypothetical protein A8F94_21815 [Bacillus sp. FJAT-27225]
MTLLSKLEKKFFFYSLLLSATFIFVVLNSSELANMANPRNSRAFHTISELISIAISFTIYTYSWRKYKHTKSNQLLYLSLVFFIIGILDFFHILTGAEMPYFFGEGSVQKTVWFWIFARGSGAILMLIVLFSPLKVQKVDRRVPLIMAAAGYIILIALMVFRYEHALPVLIREGEGPTLLKNLLEYGISTLYLIGFILTLRIYRLTGRSIYLYLSLACLCIFMSELVFTLIHSVHDVLHFTGHVYKVIGYYFVLQAVFFKLIDDDQEREKEIKRARQELDIILSEVQGIIFKVRKIENGRFVYTFCNGEVMRLLNLCSSEIVGKSIREIDETMADRVEGYYALAWDKLCHVDYEVELNGTKLFVSLKPLIFEGEVYELVGSALDITRVKEMEEVIRNNEKLGVLGELAAGIAHEVRNPLTTLKGFLQLINSDLDEHKKTFVTLMLSEVDRIEMITDEFMTVARPHSRPYKRENILEIVDQVYKFMQPQALLKSVSMNIEIKTQPEMIVCEKNQLKQIFINIIKNAIDAMPGGGNLYIRVTQPNSEEVKLDFVDEGVGIPEDMLEKIGQPFFTSKTGGHGLGLMMSRRIIEQHNGRMEIRSKLGVGTTFSIIFPTHQIVEKEKIAI